MNEVAKAEYEFIRRLVYHHSRLGLGNDKKTLVTTRLAKRLRSLNLREYDDYCRLRKSAGGAEELARLLDVISTNHTNSFREFKHFKFLQQIVLPQWMPRLERARAPFRVWSAASSSGEEPYMVAMVLAEFFRNQTGSTWGIDASDISPRVLAQARQGIYAQARLTEVPVEWRCRYFQKGINDWVGHYRVKEELRQRVRFHHLNLFQSEYPFTNQFHVILCRDVLIYFDRETQETLISKLTAQLAPGGYLMVGQTESLSVVGHSLRAIEPAVYLKPVK
ncbi:MAG: protein-glutamate O-methyltransferase CheR [Verrucomicrobia bacterium]|nr:protein-glutamate O-methyltransferase CheR [Verrucomicrobiota bacterium]